MGHDEADDHEAGGEARERPQIAHEHEGREEQHDRNDLEIDALPGRAWKRRAHHRDDQERHQHQHERGRRRDARQAMGAARGDARPEREGQRDDQEVDRELRERVQALERALAREQHERDLRRGADRDDGTGKARDREQERRVQGEPKYETGRDPQCVQGGVPLEAQSEAAGPYGKRAHAERRRAVRESSCATRKQPMMRPALAPSRMLRDVFG